MARWWTSCLPRPLLKTGTTLSLTAIKAPGNPSENDLSLLNELGEIEKLQEEHSLLLARDNPNDFIEYTQRDRQTHQYFQQAAIHRKTQQHITDNQYSLIIYPREHGKTAQVAIGRVLFELGLNVELVIKIICADGSLASKRVTALREHIDHNKKFQQVFPHVLPADSSDWGKTKFTLQRKYIHPNPTVEATSIIGSGTGDRADWLVFDDPVDERNAILQPAMRSAVKDAFYNVWLNLLPPSGFKVIYIATPWHEDDLTHELLKNSMFKPLVFGIDELYTPVWPERWDTQHLKDKRKLIGERAFNRGFRLVALADSEQIFRDIDKCLDPLLHEDSLDNMKGDTWIGVDLAISKSNNAKFTALVTVKQVKDKKYIRDVFRRRLNSVSTAFLILYKSSVFGPQSVKVENNAYQDALMDWIKLLKGMLQYIKTTEQWDEFYKEHLAKDIFPEEWVEIKQHVNHIKRMSVTITTHTTGRNKADSVIGLPNLASEVSSEVWIIPNAGHDQMCECGICALVHEAKYYPIAQTSDCLMAWWMAREASRTAKVDIRFV